MAITLGSLIEITNVGTILGQQTMNVWQYQVDGSAFLVEPVQIAEAWWNHVKATLRAIPGSDFTSMFLAVRITELNNPVGDFAEYAVPIGERGGTRSPGAAADGMPQFSAVGVRLTVGTRLTRPGQKRFAGLVEGDQANGVLAAGIVTATNTAMAVMSAPMILGAPAATIVLNPIVTRRDAAGSVVEHQPVIGWVTNPNVTTQNSRKIGRGA